MSRIDSGPGSGSYISHAASAMLSFSAKLTRGRRRNINDLPDDMLSAIFEACIPPGRHVNWNRAPTLILRVCRRWNTVALACPALWSDIRTNFSDPSLIALWVKRSQHHTLRLRSSIIDSHDDPEFSRRRAAVFDMFLHEAHRWKDINFAVGDIQATKLISVLSPNSSPFMVSLALDLDECPEHLIIKLGEAVSQAFPNLATLDLTANCTSPHALEAFPIGRATHIVLNGPIAEVEATRFISLCVNARTISMTSCLEQGIYPASAQKTTMRKLTELHLDTRVDPLRILQSFLFPSLKSLKIKCSKKIFLRWPLISYFDEAEFQLDRLHLYDLDQDLRDIHYLVRSPSVVSAKIVDIWCQARPFGVQHLSTMANPPKGVISLKSPQTTGFQMKVAHPAGCGCSAVCCG